MYARHRNDNNKAAIIKKLRESGHIVSDMSQSGNGFPDLMVQVRAGIKVWIPIEVKGDDGQLTPAETKWWAQAGCSPIIAHTPEAALEIVRTIEEALGSPKG